MKTYAIGFKNNATQNLSVNEAVNLGSVYRRYSNGTFAINPTSVSLLQSGFYKVTTTITFSAPAAGDVTFQLASNNTPIESALATETITVADTEIRSLTIDYIILVSKGCVANIPTTLIENISLLNIGVASTVTNVIFNVVKL